MASYGGRPHHPQWYLNLVGNPEVFVEVGAYDVYQAKAARDIPVVIVERM